MTNEPISQERHELLNYTLIVLRWRRLIAVVTIAAAVISLAVAFLLPKWYEAKASVIPPKQPDLFGAIAGPGSVLRSLAGGKGFSSMSQREGAYNYFAILKSRTASEAVVRKFNLMAVYQVSDSSMEKAIKELESNVLFKEEEEENITIDVMDRDPQRAADMANYYVDLLNSISAKLGGEEAGANREFIENRLRETEAALHTAEDSLEAQQKRTGLILTPEQSAGISALATLYGMKARKEVELSILERTLTPEDAQVRQATLELDALNRKLATVPATGMEAFRLYRVAAIQQKIVEFLYPLYEQARIEEHKETPVLLVLDRAVRPERKARPLRLIIVLSSTFSAFVLALAWVIGVEMFHRFRRGQPEIVQRFRSVLHERV